MYFVFTGELNLLLSCFGLSLLYSAHILKPLTQPAGLASLNSGTVRFNLSEDESATCLFRSCCIIYL